MSNISMPSSGRGQSRADPALPTSRTAKCLPAVLLSAMASALIVLADSVVGPYTDGHLVLGWISLWAVGFVALALLSRQAGRVAGAVTARWRSAAIRRQQRRADASLMALAEHDPSLMEDIRAAMQRANPDAPELDAAWMERHPVGTFNAAYQGRRRPYRVTPLAGFPAYMQYLPG